MVTVAAVKQVEERARQQECVRQYSEDVSPVLAQEEECADCDEAEEDELRSFFCGNCHLSISLSLIEQPACHVATSQFL